MTKGDKQVALVSYIWVVFLLPLACCAVTSLMAGKEAWVTGIAFVMVVIWFMAIVVGARYIG